MLRAPLYSERMLPPVLAALALAVAQASSPPAPPSQKPAGTWSIPLPGEPLGDRPGVTGTIRVHRGMAPAKVNGLKPRDVFVRLPRGYENMLKADQRYPVLYVHDGQNQFDPATAFLGREWHLDEAVDELEMRGWMPPVIVVAISNTPDRVADYTPDADPQEARTDGKPQGKGGEGARYLDWIANELKPFIDANYRTQRGPDTTAMMGSSLGGIISMAAAERHPGVFGCVAAVSPSLWWNGGSVIDRWKAKPPALRRLWIDMGDKERAGLCDELRRFEKAMQPVYGRSMHAEVVPGGRHDEPTWSARLPRILKFLFAERDWQLVQPPEPVPPPGLPAASDPASPPQAPTPAAPPAAPK